MTKTKQELINSSCYGGYTGPIYSRSWSETQMMLFAKAEALRAIEPHKRTQVDRDLTVTVEIVTKVVSINQ